MESANREAPGMILATGSENSGFLFLGRVAGESHRAQTPLRVRGE